MKWSFGVAVVLVLTWVLVASLSAQTPLSAQLRGRVVSRMETPLIAAEVAIHGTPHATLTDSAGRFTLRDLPPGEHVIRVRRIGFSAQYLAATLLAGAEKQVTIVLEPGAYELPEVEVTARAAKPIEYAYTSKYDDFFRRQRVGLGHYISRADIEQMQPWRTPSLLHGIPGVRVRFRHAGSSGTDVWFSGCERISVWVDGWKQKNAELPPADPRRGLDGPGANQVRQRSAMAVGAHLEQLLPGQIEMIEVYTSAAGMPAEFLDDSCGAIAIWTR